MTKKQEFIDLYKRYIKREGADDLLEFLMSSKSDFFEAPCSTRFHLSQESGLVEHSINVYECLKAYLERPRVKEVYGLAYSDETIAIVALLHDLCKINVYKKTSRNVKDSSGKWIQVPSYEFQDDLPYGHGEKSVYIISGFMKLTRDEAFAIRYHMGFSDTENTRNVGEAFSRFPLAFALSTADMEATYFLEK
jgi:hypothetical protein